MHVPAWYEQQSSPHLVQSSESERISKMSRRFDVKISRCMGSECHLPLPCIGWRRGKSHRRSGAPLWLGSAQRDRRKTQQDHRLRYGMVSDVHGLPTVATPHEASHQTAAGPSTAIIGISIWCEVTGNRAGLKAPAGLKFPWAGAVGAGIRRGRHHRPKRGSSACLFRLWGRCHPWHARAFS